MRRSVQARIDEGPGGGMPVVVEADQAAGFAERMTGHIGELTALVDDLVSSGFIDDRPATEPSGLNHGSVSVQRRA